MKKYALISLAMVLALSPSLTPKAYANDIAQSLCEYIATDDKKRLRSFLKAKNLKIRTIFDSVQCNGQNLLTFAASNNAIDTGAMIIYKLPKKTVSDNLAAIKAIGASLVDVANTRIAD